MPYFPDETIGYLRLAEAAWGSLGIAAHLMRPTRYDPKSIAKQIKASWISGYIRALRDVKAEREKQEQQSYADSFPTISVQELAAISHVYSSK